MFSNQLQSDVEISWINDKFMTIYKKNMYRLRSRSRGDAQWADGGQGDYQRPVVGIPRFATEAQLAGKSLSRLWKGSDATYKGIGRDDLVMG